MPIPFGMDDPAPRRGGRDRRGRVVVRALVVVVTAGVAVAGFAATAPRAAVPDPSVHLVAPFGADAAAVASRPAATAAAGEGLRSTAPAGSERLGVGVVGSTMSLEPRSSTVALFPASDGTMHGTLGTVRVVDARGTLRGWKVVASLARAPTSADEPSNETALEVRDVRVQPLDGQRSGLYATSHERLGRSAVALAGARPGYGGGTYLVDAEVVARPAVPLSGATITAVVHLRVVPSRTAS